MIRCQFEDSFLILQTERESYTKMSSFGGYIFMTRLFKFGLVLLLLPPFRDPPMRQVLDLAFFVMGFILCLPSYSLNYTWDKQNL